MSLINEHFTQYPAEIKLVTPVPRITRRKFLHATVATAGGILMTDVRKLKANSITFLSKRGSTEYLWYRPQPEGPYIDSQRDNKAFGFTDGAVFLSDRPSKRLVPKLHSNIPVTGSRH